MLQRKAAFSRRTFSIKVKELLCFIFDNSRSVLKICQHCQEVVNYYIIMVITRKVISYYFVFLN